MLNSLCANNLAACFKSPVAAFSTSTGTSTCTSTIFSTISGCLFTTCSSSSMCFFSFLLSSVRLFFSLVILIIFSTVSLSTSITLCGTMTSFITSTGTSIIFSTSTIFSTGFSISTMRSGPGTSTNLSMYSTLGFSVSNLSSSRIFFFGLALQNPKVSACLLYLGQFRC